MDGAQVLIPLLAILVGGMAVIIPVAGLTARFALKPLVDSYVRARGIGTAGETEGLARRVALLEDQVQALEAEQARLLEERDFRERLGAGRG